ncbi:MAG: hypothetical protein GWN71_34865, partial [Gammaproteobacteria bacterium]|nr:hypothetical protein [Gammaproteobacteria bacterium]
MQSVWLEERRGCLVEELSGTAGVHRYHEQEDDVVSLLEVIERNRPRRTALD